MNGPGATQVVIVPSTPGPLQQLNDATGESHEVDVVLNEMFGEPDEGGPGVADAALVGGGAIAVAAAQLAVLPAAVTVGGIAAIGLGAILPLRSLYRKALRAAQQNTMSKLVGDGMLLDTRHAAVQRLVASHAGVYASLDTQPASIAMRSRSVAHTLVVEVASLLGGHEVGADEASYVTARADAMEELEAALTRPTDGPSRQAQVAARLEVESAAGTSGLSDASELTSDLLGDREL